MDIYIHVDNREKSRASDKKHRRRISLEEKLEHFIAAVRKWEMLAASKVSGSEKNKSEQEHEQQNFGEHIRQFLHNKQYVKYVTMKFHVLVVQNGIVVVQHKEMDCV